MSQIIKKFIGANQVGASQIRLENNLFLRGRDNGDSNDISILKISAADEAVLVDAAETVVLNLQTREMLDSTAAVSIDMENRMLKDATAIVSMNYASRVLADVAGTSAIDFSLASKVQILSDAVGGVARALSFQNGDADQEILIQAPQSLAASYTLTLPVDDGTSGQVLSTNGSGVLSWASPGAGTVTSITAGTGLNGGTITSSGTIDLADTAVTPGSYTSANITVDAQGRITAAANGSASATNSKELIVLSGTDITNQYVDLSQVALTDSISFLVRGGGVQIEGASYDYTVSYTGGAGGNTRISFVNGLATGGVSELIAADVVVVQYQY